MNEENATSYMIYTNYKDRIAYDTRDVYPGDYVPFFAGEDCAIGHIHVTNMQVSGFLHYEPFELLSVELKILEVQGNARPDLDPHDFLIVIPTICDIPIIDLPGSVCFHPGYQFERPQKYSDRMNFQTSVKLDKTAPVVGMKVRVIVRYRSVPLAALGKQLWICIGDYSNDGHGEVDHFLFDVNAPPEVFRAAYFRAKEKFPHLCPELDCAKYGERLIPHSRYEEICKAFPRRLPRDSGDKEEGGFRPTPWFMAVWTMLFCRLGGERLEFERSKSYPITDFFKPDEEGRKIGQIGYGLYE